MQNDYQNVGKFLIVAGLAMVVIGLVMVYVPKANLFRLPGDVNVEGDGFRFSFPIVSCIVISVLLTLISWIVKFFNGGR